jgi:hypothetical protein
MSWSLLEMIMYVFVRKGKNRERDLSIFCAAQKMLVCFRLTKIHILKYPLGTATTVARFFKTPTLGLTPVAFVLALWMFPEPAGILEPASLGISMFIPTDSHA